MSEVVTERDVPDGCLGTDTLCDFLEGRVRPDMRQRVHEHASRCAACRELLSSLGRTDTPAIARAAPPEPNAARPLPAGTIVGRYVIEHPIGAGGMGVVYAARDPQLGRLVAVKRLRGDSHPSTEERVRREAQAMARLAHPNVVAVYDVGMFEQRIFVAMEYVVGSTLAMWNTAPRQPQEILDAYCEAGRGLAAAHSAGIVHRDFKPENVFIGHDGRVRVGDFGVARTTQAIGPAYAAVPASGAAALPTAVDESTKPPRLTAPGTLIGTPYYIAPELYDGADADAQSDQFSFCVALFTTLYGDRPFEGDSFATLASNVRAGRIHRPKSSRVARSIHAAIRRGLSADPAARFPSLRHLLSELQPDPRRRAGRFVAITAGVVIAAALAFAAWRSSDDEACSGMPSGLVAWRADRRTAIEAAFARSGAPYAASALRQVTGALDRYSARLANADAVACRATAGPGGGERARQMLCLEPRRQEAVALIDLLATADLQTIRRAVDAVTTLRDPAVCEDDAVLQRIAAPPASAAIRAVIVALARRLGDARAHLATGAYAQARALAGPVVAAAHTIGYRPLEAEAALLDGEILRALGDDDAERALMSAIWSAEAGRDDGVAARARILLVAVVGVDRAEPARARTLIPLATAAIARLGDNPALDADLESTLGTLALAQRDTEAAVGHFEKSVAFTQRISADSLVLANALAQLGRAVLAQGHAERAAELERRSLEMLERLVGSEHPDVRARR